MTDSSSPDMTAQGSTYGIAGNRAVDDLRRYLQQHGPDEESALLTPAQQPSPARSKAAPHGIRAHLTADVSRDKADLILLFSYLITGLLDSSATAIWGSFVSMQTGNTVFLGIGLADPYSSLHSPSSRWIRALLSIAGFCFGAFAFARLHAALSPRTGRTRWVLAAGAALQFLCVLVAAVIVTLTPDPRAGAGAVGAGHWHVLVPIAVVSFQASGQASVSRALQYGSLTSVVLTSIYANLFADPHLLALANADRNRRVAAPLLLLVGALVGGLWARSEVGMMGALWTAAGLKLCVVLTWLLWKAEGESEGVVEA
ncbi:hypothetical protein F5B20DRAFT_578228 [Whalleya microplaca]|nr:hypothetical protein F5B20DRAFT_578228 [Whalleya microplaca]